MVTVTAPHPRLPADGSEARRSASRWRRTAGHPALVAVVSWAVALPVAWALPAALDENPFTARAMMLPLAAGGLLLACLAGLSLWTPAARRLGGALTGLSAGIFAAWVALTLRTALYGTPFGYDGLGNDKARLTAMATRYSVTAGSADHFVPGVPNDYPPLFPWLVGRAAALAGVPAWKLVGIGEVLTMSAAALVAFLLWRRIVPDVVAVAVPAAGLVAFDTPSKAFAVVATAAFVPWVVMTFTPSASGTPGASGASGAPGASGASGAAGRPARLHWLPAGAIGGLLVLTYYGYLVYAGPGLLALAAAGWRASPGRWRYVRHLAGTAAVAFAVSSWFVVPYIVTAATAGTQMVALRYIDPKTGTNAFPFLEPTLLGALQLAGLAGVVWYRRSRPWAGPLLFLVAGTYVYRALALAWLVVDGHNRQINYTTRLIGPLLAAAGVLTVAAAGPALARRLRAVPPRGTGAAALVVLFAWAGLQFWQDTMPATKPMYRENLPTRRVSSTNTAVRAHTEQLPGGERPRFAPKVRRSPGLPVTRVRREVERRYGPGARPMTLSYSEYLFSFLPWPGYIGVSDGAANAMTRWDDRFHVVKRLTREKDPAAFAARSAATPFGRIDVFVLSEMPSEKGRPWRWRDLRFRPWQFDRARFEVIAGLPQHTVLAIRRR